MGGQLAEQLAIIGGVAPAVQSAGTVNTDVVDMRYFSRLLVAVSLGAYGAAGATFNVQLYANTANSTSGGTAITGKTFTASTFSGSAAGTNKQGLIEVTSEEVGTALAGARYVYGVVTVGTNTVAAAVVMIGGGARYEPASDFDIASVAQIVS